MLEYTVANADSNMFVAGVLATSSLPHMHVVYPLYNNIYSPEVMSLPPLEKFHEESESEISEQFTDWIEHFELVASAYHWDNHMKLVNLTTRLRGQAFAFFWSSSTQHWGNYMFIQVVQSSLF